MSQEPRSVEEKLFFLSYSIKETEEINTATKREDGTKRKKKKKKEKGEHSN